MAALLFLAGLVAAGLTLFRTLSGTIGDLQTVIMPGTHEIMMDEPGRYTIFVEFPTAFGPEPGVDQLRVEVRSVETGPLALARPEGSFNYTLGERTGEAVLAFDVEVPGDYTIVGGYPTGSEGPEVVLAVAAAFGTRLFTGIGLSLLIPLLTWSGAIAIAVMTFLRRKRHQ